MLPRCSGGPTHSASTAPSSFEKRCAAISTGLPPKAMRIGGSPNRWTTANERSRRSPIGALPRTGRTGSMQRGEVWFAATPGGDRPVLVLTRDPVADRIGAVVVAALTSTRRGLVSELDLTADGDGVPTDCVVNFDNLHTLPRDMFRRSVTALSPARMAQACRALAAATGS